MIPQAQVVHSVPGRLRIKVPVMRGNVQYFEKLRRHMLEEARVDGVLFNVDTGSLLIGHDWDTADALTRLGHEHGWFDLQPAPFDPLWQRASDTLQRIDRRMSTFTRNELGLRSALLVLLVGMALRQALQGQVLVPATTLLWYALQLVGLPAEGLRQTEERAALAQRHSVVTSGTSTDA